jgi:FkbM family methyltransferase
MNNFGKYKPSFSINIILILVKIGLGRGKLKHLFSRIIKKYNNLEYLDLIYNGLKIRLSPLGNTIESKILLSSKIREEIELNEVKKAVRSKGVFIDVGANVGYYSLFAAKFGAKKIISFEPNPVLCKRFKKNIELNKFEERINLFECALGDKRGNTRLNLNKNDIGSSSLLKDSISTNFINVEVFSLIEILETKDIKKIDALKIDVEGFEDKVMKPFFEKSNQKLYPKIVIIEDLGKEQWEWDVISWMLKHGYKLVNRTKSNLILRYIK